MSTTWTDRVKAELRAQIAERRLNEALAVQADDLGPEHAAGDEGLARVSEP